MKHLRIFDGKALCRAKGQSWRHVPAVTCGDCLAMMDSLLDCKGASAAVIQKNGLKYFEVDRRFLHVSSDVSNEPRDRRKQGLRGWLPEAGGSLFFGLSRSLRELWSQERIESLVYDDSPLFAMLRRR